MDPVSIAVLLPAVYAVVAQHGPDILTHVVGAELHDKLKGGYEYLRSLNPQLNHDLQRAFRLAYLRAIQQLIQAAKDSLPSAQGFLSQTDRAEQAPLFEKLANAVESERKRLDEPTAALNIPHCQPEVLLALQKSSAAERFQELLHQDLKNDIGRWLPNQAPPPAIAGFLREGWTDIKFGQAIRRTWLGCMAEAFVELLKEHGNEPLRTVFQTRQLLVIDSKLDVTDSKLDVIIEKLDDKKGAADLKPLHQLPPPPADFVWREAEPKEPRKARDEYRAALIESSERLEKTSRNPSSDHFYCKSGVPLGINIEWPLKVMYGKSGAPLAASCVRVWAYDLCNEGMGSIFWVVITDAQAWSFPPDPTKTRTLLEKHIVKTTRNAVDEKKLLFFPLNAPPEDLQQVKLDMSSPPRPQADKIHQYLMGKVYWLAFKAGDKSTQVWIADPWDADYLGVNPQEFIQAAQVLAAQRVLVLDSSQEFASAGEVLLQRAVSFENKSSPIESQRPGMEKSHSERQWDLFICHASEDKDDFVRPLAQALRGRGLRVWYDEFTLTIGDSLRRSIDRGLASSRFGVVVLSPSFFAKEWPQRELDGLVAKEIEGRKVILPVWHKLTRGDVFRYSPTLADKVAASSSEGIDIVVAKILEAIREE